MESKQETPIESLIAQRRDTLKRLTSNGINPYAYHFTRTHTIAALLKDFSGPLPEHGSDQKISTAGRVMTVRDMGKSSFAHLADGPQRLQIYLKKDVVGDAAYQMFQKDIDIGDFVGVEGTMFRT